MADTKGNKRKKYINRNKGEKKTIELSEKKQKEQNNLKEKILRS